VLDPETARDLITFAKEHGILDATERLIEDLGVKVEYNEEVERDDPLVILKVLKP
jgi:hypothetical protein